jgi:hypothetical protein
MDGNDIARLRDLRRFVDGQIRRPGVAGIRVVAGFGHVDSAGGQGPRARKWPVSLVALGTSFELTRFRVTSYDFNSAAAARTTAEHLLHPRRKLPGQVGNTLDIQGVLVDRGSFRRVYT